MSVVGKKFRDGQTICHQGELGDCMYIIQEGSVELLQRTGENEFCLGVLEKGDSFGEGALLEDAVFPITIRALGETVVLTVARHAFLRRVHEDPAFALHIIRKMSSRIRWLEAALVRSANVGELGATLVGPPK
jgi:CRP/FNR family transcriptional regulator, cyclic AMP receptor protein